MVLLMQDGLRLFLNGNPGFPLPDPPDEAGRRGGEGGPGAEGVQLPDRADRPDLRPAGQPLHPREPDPRRRSGRCRQARRCGSTWSARWTSRGTTASPSTASPGRSTASSQPGPAAADGLLRVGHQLRHGADAGVHARRTRATTPTAAACSNGRSRRACGASCASSDGSAGDRSSAGFWNWSGTLPGGVVPSATVACAAPAAVHPEITAAAVRVDRATTCAAATRMPSTPSE